MPNDLLALCYVPPLRFVPLRTSSRAHQLSAHPSLCIIHLVAPHSQEKEEEKRKATIAASAPPPPPPSLQRQSTVSAPAPTRAAPAEDKTPSDLKRDEGNAAFRSKDFATAIALYTAAVDLDPNNPHNYCNRGMAAKSAGQLEQALADFSMAIQVKPDYCKAYFQRSNIYFDAKEYAMALHDANQAKLIDAADPAITARIQVRFPRRVRAAFMPLLDLAPCVHILNHTMFHSTSSF